jgi:dienelactone hydrolase
MVTAVIVLMPFALVASGANDVVIQLPAPDGPYSVGYWKGDLPTKQMDGLSGEPGNMRRLGLSIWYPAAQPSSGPVKPWASEAMGRALSEGFPFETGFQKDISGHSREGASPMAGPLPVVIFSPGLSFPLSLYQSFFEDLASRGYVVLGVAHPHTVALVEYPDGTTLDMAAWPRIEQETERQAFLAAHLSTLDTDLRAVIEWIEAGAPDSPLSGRLDEKRIASLGHSYGGSAAARITHDPRIKAAVVMEGAVRDPADKYSRGKLVVGTPLMHLIGGYNRLEHEGDQYLPAVCAPVYQVVINGTGHAYFSDLIYLYKHYADSEWKSRHRYEIEPARVLQISRDYIAAFLGRYLNDEEPSVLLRPKSYADSVDSPGRGGYPEADLSISVR